MSESFQTRLVSALSRAVCRALLGAVSDDGSEASLSVRRYQAAVGFMAYENTVFWTRAGFFLVAETALLGFIGSNLPEYGAKQVSVQAVGALVLSIVGLVMSRLWWLALRRGEYWILERKRIVDQLEEAALGELRMIRGEDPDLLGPRRGGAKSVAYHLVRLFFAVWLLLALYTSAVLTEAFVEGRTAANNSLHRTPPRYVLAQAATFECTVRLVSLRPGVEGGAGELKKR